ncbi:ribosome maturation protein SBDS-like protein [Cladochytrium replicatum]|nr:ribosome maturation protein SBDS-like protein [Cladochytrium replicatum]
MGTIFTPANQVKLTNVSVVRLKKGGKRFEIAAYKNKVMEWRSGVETDLDNVIQIDQVFVNVSKGQLANKEELTKAFKTDDKDKILKEILQKGELQVGEKERGAQLESLAKEIATTVAGMCVDPSTKVPHPVGIIEQAMQDLHFSVNPNKNAKQQALDVIRQIEAKNLIPIARASMRIRLVAPGKEGKLVKEKILSMVQIEDEDWGDEYEMIATINPSSYRSIAAVVEAQTRGKGQLEVLSVKEVREGDEMLT